MKGETVILQVYLLCLKHVYEVYRGRIGYVYGRPQKLLWRRGGGKLRKGSYKDKKVSPPPPPQEEKVE